MNEVLKKLIDTADMYSRFLQQDLAISISDNEKYLAIFNTEILVFPFEVGTRIDASGYGDVLNELKRTGKSFVNYIPKEITGTVPIKAVISPIYDNGTVVGYFSVSINNEKESLIKDVSEDLFLHIGNSGDSIKNMVNVSQNLNNQLQDMYSITQSSVEDIKDGTKAIELIKGIATQSNMLGLNAAIEAARAGEQGKGFSVVASEMRNLAVKSKQTAEQVEASLKKVAESINNIMNVTNIAKDLSNDQSEETNEITKKIDVIAKKTEDLVSYSNL